MPRRTGGVYLELRRRGSPAARVTRSGARAVQLAEFNEEIARRLTSLDRGELLDPVVSRTQLERKSQERRAKRE